MPSPDERVRAVVLRELNSEEAGSCVVYLAAETLPAGTTLTFPRATVEFPWAGRLAFVDLDPMANWAHACRYVCIEPDTGAIRSTDATLPPFGTDRPGKPHLEWRVLYKAPRVPAAVLAVPLEGNGAGAGTSSTSTPR